MNLKLALLKLAVRAKRKKEIRKSPVGERFFIPRIGKNPVDVLLYRPKTAKPPYPVLFNIHGGAWVGCDASQMDSYCLDMTEKCGTFIVNINYTKVDVHPFPYPQEEICDTILYFREHADEYSVDKDRFSLIGYSAGGHLAAASTLMLHRMGVDIAAQVLCYAFLDFRKMSEIMPDEKDCKMMQTLFFGQLTENDPRVSPSCATDAMLRGLAPTVFVCCGGDPLTGQDKDYQARLEANGVPTVFKLYEEAIHGFLEVNHKEYPAQEAKNPKQEALAKEAEDAIVSALKAIWNKGAEK